MKRLFNDNWRFKLLELEPIQSEKNTDKDKMTEDHSFLSILNGNDWYNVEIPHDWLILDTRNLYKDGDGWYKKDFLINAEDLNKIHTLIFDGVYMNATVFVNSEISGEWKYGYSTFELNISNFIKEGENTIAIRVRHESPNTRWYSGAGIFRNIWYKMQEKTRIINDGVYFNTSRLKDGWNVRIKTEYVGETDESEKIYHTLYNMDGIEVLSLTAESVKTIEANEINECCLKKAISESVIKNPVLWDVEHPYVYCLKTELFSNGIVVDCEKTQVGFRTVEFFAEKGFYLNNRRIKLHGVCMHHDLGALGSAMNKNALRRQLEIMKEMGANAIRISHNPPAREFMELCNELGLMVESEAFDMWELPKTKNDYSRFFPDWHKKDVASWVRRDRNHPCLIMWSIGNEIYDMLKDKRGLELTEILRDEVLKHDPNENGKVTTASNYMMGENTQRCVEAVKIAGYNYAEYLYDEHHKKYPDWFIYGSETVSCVRSRGVYHLPADTPVLVHDDLQCSDMGNSVVGWGCSCERTWVDDRDREYCGGQFIWTGFDYIGEPTPYSTKNSYFGIVDTAGLPKASYYFYKAVWNTHTKPFIKLFPHWDWNEGQTVDVIAYSNVSCAELFFNGSSLGKQYIDLLKDKVLHYSWQVKYQPGELVIRAYDDNGGVVASDRKSSFSEPAKLIAKYAKEPIYGNGTDLKFVEISAEDKNGEPVENARNRIFFEIKRGSGVIRLAGLDNGDSTDYDSYKGSNRKLFSGKLVAIFQSSTDCGQNGEDVEIEITSKGLEKAVVCFSVLPCERPEGIFVPFSNVYPAYVQEIDYKTYTRKIELKSDITELNRENNTARVTACILPENSEYRDIVWKCVLDKGSETNIAVISGDSCGADITAKGDGKFRVRACCYNGKKNPEVISELEFFVSGLGAVINNPYEYTQASTYAQSNYTFNIVSGGAIEFRKKSVIGFTNMDFGNNGTDNLILYLGCCSNQHDIELWIGNPETDGKKSVLVDILKYPTNNIWYNYTPSELKLSKKITGVQTISFVVNKRCIFGGFKFKDSRAFEINSALSYSSIYGDDFRLAESAIENIGNNVLIGFKGYDFGDEGINGILIEGKTKKDKNSITIRFDNDDGIQKTVLLEFDGCNEHTNRTFDIEKLCGVWNFEFVFLPGSDFDFKSFRFI